MIYDAARHALRLTYGSRDGRLESATQVPRPNAPARSLRFTWGDRHVTAVATDPVTAGGEPLRWTYSYTGDLLTGVCGPAQACTTYTYAAGSHYRSAVLDSSPTSYYRLAEPDGPAAASEVATNLGRDAGTYTSVTRGTVGALPGRPTPRPRSPGRPPWP